MGIMIRAVIKGGSVICKQTGGLSNLDRTVIGKKPF